MNEREQLEAIARMPIVLEIPGMREVAVRPTAYLDSSAEHSMDVYASALGGEPRPAVVFVYGFPQPRMARGLKDMECYRSWARLLAASGFVAVTYRYVEPIGDLRLLLGQLRARAADLGIDPARIAIWSCSGNVPVALGALVEEARAGRGLCAAALCYGYMPDDGNAAGSARAAFGFAVPEACSVDDLPPGLPLLVVRAGRDQTPGLNVALDRFVARAIARNLPLTLLNHPTGPHAFDIFDPSESSRAAIRAVVAFLRLHAGLV